MRKVILSILCLALLPACSNEGGESPTARADFNKALATFDNAQQGYLGQGKGSAADDLTSYREAQLAQAASDLKSLINQGSDAQRIAAALLLADAQSSLAQYTARDAMTRWADLSLRATDLTQQLQLVDQAAAEAASLDVDYAPLLDKLHKDQQTATSGIGDMEKQAQSLQDTAARDQAIIDGLRSQSQSDRARDQTLRRQAFSQEGQVQEKLYRQAMDADFSAISEQSSLQKQSAEMDVCLSELAILNRQIDLRRAAAHGLQDQIVALQAQQKTLRDRHDDALADKDKAIQLLQDRSDNISKIYAESVAAPLVDACAKANSAIDALQMALSKVPIMQKRQYQFNLLVKRTILASIMTRQVYAASGYRQLLEPLAGQSARLMPGVTTFTDAYQHAKESQDALAAKAKDAIAAGVKLATDIQGSDDKAADMLTQLQGYVRGIDDAIGATPPAPAAAPAPAPTDTGQ